MILKDLKIGESGKIIKIGGEGALRQHLLDMGVIPDAILTVEKYAPMGDPMEISIHGYELTLRLNEAQQITVEKTSKPSLETHLPPKESSHHTYLHKNRYL